MSKNLLFYLLVLVGAGLVLYLSWVPVPKMAQFWFIPPWLASWADENRNDTIRTAVPLVGLGALVGGWLAVQGRPWRQWLLAWVALSGLVVAAEVGQLFRAERSFDQGDIAWGVVGALVGLGLVAALKGIYQAVKL
ncbi:MAG: hypothetical protein EOO56_02465 [Hymenobacter sp.]|nr:MAG: hypothetical protein EOO56_02465 [Hymenobacter sp.]